MITTPHWCAACIDIAVHGTLDRAATVVLTELFSACAQNFRPVIRLNLHGVTTIADDAIDLLALAVAGLSCAVEIGPFNRAVREVLTRMGPA